MASRFTEIVTKYGPRAMADLTLSAPQAGGLFGNGDIESAGFSALQEISPLVEGSAGGYGWMQWTGPRRRAYLAWCKSAKLNPASDEANYRYMVVELLTVEKAALRLLRATTSADQAATVVCTKYLRPGIPHLDKRLASARRALALLGGPAVAPVLRPRIVGIAEQPAAPPAAVQTVAPAGAPHGMFSALWARLTGKPSIGVPVIAGSRGDPTIFYVQKTLREKAYYTKGFLDGLDGGLTQGAVAQARKDNGMGDGGIDAAFLAKLPTFPQRPVSVERSTVTLSQAAEHAPELFTPPKWLISAGLGSLGLGGASGAGLMDNVQGAVGKANDVFGQVQTAIGFVASAVAFVVEHKTLFLVAAGAVLVWKGVSALLSAWIKVRQAFF